MKEGTNHKTIEEFFGPKVEVKISTKSDGPMNFVGHEHFDSERRANRAQFLSRRMGLKLTDVVMPQMIHGSTVMCVDQHNPIWEMVKADAIVTGKPRLGLTMTMGDCPPVLLYDPVTEVIAAIHGGWKSLHAKIIENTISSMKANFNVDPANIRAYVGPGICHKCFEIGPEVARKFGVETLKNVYFSLQNEIDTRLLSCGVLRRNMEDSLECTVCTKKDGENPKYFSWRRDRTEPLSVQMAVIIIK
jgi:YfiH family protein